MTVNTTKVCPICGESVDTYDKNKKCKKYHDWRKSWRKNKNTQKYKEYLLKRKQSMEKAARRRLEKLDKQTPTEYKNRNKTT